MHPVYAALTPLIATDSPFDALSGVSLRVTLSARDDSAKRNATATGGFLFTHQGYSGPSVLDVSHVAVRSRAESPPRRPRDSRCSGRSSAPTSGRRRCVRRRTAP